MDKDSIKTEQLSGKQVFEKVKSDSVSNVLLYGLFALAIFLLGFLSWWLAVILLGVYVLIIGFDALILLTTQVITLPIILWYKLFGKEKDEATDKDQKYDLFSMIIRLTETSFLLFLAYLLYLRFF